jgi:hypothetical protein
VLLPLPEPPLTASTLLLREAREQDVAVLLAKPGVEQRRVVAGVGLGVLTRAITELDLDPPPPSPASCPS